MFKTKLLLHQGLNDIKKKICMKKAIISATKYDVWMRIYERFIACAFAKPIKRMKKRKLSAERRKKNRL